MFHRTRCIAIWSLVLPVGIAMAAAKPTVKTKPATPPKDLGPKLDRNQLKQLKVLLGKFKTAADAPARKAAFEKTIGMGPRAAAMLKPIVDAKLQSEEKRYIQTLEPKIRAAYLKRLGDLNDAQILQAQKTRRMWKPYVLHGGGRDNFQKTFLKPVWDMAACLLLKPQDILDSQLETHRNLLREWAAYQSDVHRILKIDPDPTQSKRSPTNIKYAPLDQPPTFMDKLNHLERTLILANTLAPPGARKGLMMNDQAAREIDVQEAEYVMFGNEVRLLTGTIVWRADPLGCAVTRDHSNDRKDGKASGHMSSIPEKRGFPDRNRRMGSPFFNSEGAGGGRNGRGYINGLSYSGAGHGGPLYSLKRNCVGVGRRGGVYTSQYRFDKSIVHPAQATDHELFMPPGIERKEIRNGTLRLVFKALQAEAFGAAHRMLTKAEPAHTIDKTLMRFFAAAIQAEVDWFFESAAAIEKTSDVYALKNLLTLGSKKFKGIPAFEEKIAEWSKKLTGEEVDKQVRAGAVYHKIVQGNYDKPKLTQYMARFLKKYEGTIYAEAVKPGLEDEKGNRFVFFFQKNPAVRKYEYPAPPANQK